jgi:hypothetical protein
VGRIELDGAEGDLDFHSFAGHFRVRVESMDDDYGGVNLSVAGGDAWRDFGVRLDPPNVNRTLTKTSEWKQTEVAPCRSKPKGLYSYRAKTYQTMQVFRAHSHGDEKPAYTWYLNDTLLDPSGRQTTVTARCRRVELATVKPAEELPLQCDYAANSHC